MRLYGNHPACYRYRRFSRNCGTAAVQSTIGKAASEMTASNSILIGVQMAPEKVVLILTSK